MQGIDVYKSAVILTRLHERQARFSRGGDLQTYLGISHRYIMDPHMLSKLHVE